MPGATYPRVHVWGDNEDVYASDLNAEFNNILDHQNPSGLSGYEENLTQLQKTTSPGEPGSEVLATSLAGEIERLRYMIARLGGGAYWYSPPALSISDLSTALSSGLAVPSNRVSSGRVSATNQPMALTPDATLAKVTLKAATTPFVYFVNGTRYVLSADVSLTGLTLAPSTQNTAVVNDATFTATALTAAGGSFGTTITIGTVGTNISALVGKYAAFKLVHAGSTEYFIAYVNSATQLSLAYRGHFFDSSDGAIKALPISNGDTLTLMKLTYIFLKTDGTLDFTYNAPTQAYSAPASPSTGDFWYDLSAGQWKKYSGTAWAASLSVPVGIAIQDATKTVGARSYHYYFPPNSLNTIKLVKDSNTLIRGTQIGQRIYVAGSTIHYQHTFPTWNSSGQFASGVTLQPSTTYYCYVTDQGALMLDTAIPQDRGHDLLGFYHPSNPWRAVGYFTTDGSSNFGTPFSYGSIVPNAVPDWLGVNNYPVVTENKASSNINVFPQAALTMLRGNVTSVGGFGATDGFTVNKTGTGVYVITPTNAFGDSPTIIVSLTGAGTGYADTIFPGSFTVHTLNAAGAATDLAFDFIAVGRRA